jgi:hypothetical protein
MSAWIRARIGPWAGPSCPAHRIDRCALFVSAAVNERDNQSICAFKTKNVSPKCVCVHTIKVIDSVKWPTNHRPPIKDTFFE